MKLKGKTAIVTGSSSGLGQATAIEFAKEGANVVVNTHLDASAAEETMEAVKEAGGEAVFCQADVAKEADCERLAQTAVDKWGRLDILVNNAGIEIRGGVATLSVEDWDKMLDVDLKGVFLCSKYGVKAMQAGGGGSIVNIASVLSFDVIPERAAYCSAKGGVLQLTRSIALDHGPDNIRCNNLAPGAFLTPLLQRSLEDSGAYEEIKEVLTNKSPLGRMGDFAELARCAVFLASDDASFVTGSTLHCDGGWFLK